MLFAFTMIFTIRRFGDSYRIVQSRLECTVSATVRIFEQPRNQTSILKLEVNHIYPRAPPSRSLTHSQELSGVNGWLTD